MLYFVSSGVAKFWTINWVRSPDLKASNLQTHCHYRHCTNENHRTQFRHLCSKVQDFLSTFTHARINKNALQK